MKWGRKIERSAKTKSSVYVWNLVAKKDKFNFKNVFAQFIGRLCLVNQATTKR